VIIWTPVDALLPYGVKGGDKMLENEDLFERLSLGGGAEEPDLKELIDTGYLTGTCE
jgi:hypothetical protein